MIALVEPQPKSRDKDTLYWKVFRPYGIFWEDHKIWKKIIHLVLKLTSVSENFMILPKIVIKPFQMQTSKGIFEQFLNSFSTVYAMARWRCQTFCVSHCLIFLFSSLTSDQENLKNYNFLPDLHNNPSEFFKFLNIFWFSSAQCTQRLGDGAKLLVFPVVTQSSISILVLEIIPQYPGESCALCT